MDLFTIAAIAVGLLYLVGLYRRRQEAIHNLRYLILSLVAGAFAYGICQSQADLENAAPLIGIGAAFILYNLRPRRKRQRSRSVRRRVIAKWEYETGKKYNPQKHEVDHIVPFSDGGSDTEDNLRVIERRDNRAKGAKVPWWDVFGRR